MYVYLNNAATTRVDGRVLYRFSKFFRNLYENPMTSVYSPGAKEVEAEIEKARKEVADLINASRKEIYFTSGGTESDNWAIKGIALNHWEEKGEIISTPIEHSAVLSSLKTVREWGFSVKFLHVDKFGMVDPDEVRKLITNKTILISVMHANNEIGTIEPIKEIGEIAREREVIFHTDAVQTAAHIPIDVEEMNVDLLSMSAHKFYGPKGVGALYIREGVKIKPFMDGGHQERGFRAGTHNVPGIVGMGEAAKIGLSEMDKETREILELKNYILKRFEKIEGIYVNGHPEKRLPGNINISIEGVKAETMLLYLGLNGIIVSAGSACSAKEKAPSHVLKAIEIPEDLYYNTIRISLGKFNTFEEIEYFLEVFETGIKEYRRIKP